MQKSIDSKLAQDDAAIVMQKLIEEVRSIAIKYLCGI